VTFLVVGDFFITFARQMPKPSACRSAQAECVDSFGVTTRVPKAEEILSFNWNLFHSGRLTLSPNSPKRAYDRGRRYLDIEERLERSLTWFSV